MVNIVNPDTINTIDTIMTKLTKLRVHVCPIGYEVDRIVVPAKDLRADIVWLIVEANPRKEKAIKFIKEVKTKLNNLGIEVKIKGVDRNDLFDNLRGLKEIFVTEQGNDIQVNVSAGSKIQAIAGMMACMMFRKEYSPKPYYAEPESHGNPPKLQLTSGKQLVLPLPDYEIKKPSDEEIRALKIIHDNGGRLSKTRLAKLVINNEILELSNVDGKVEKGDYKRLESRIIKPLKEWNYVTVKKIGREHMISTTTEGQDALKFLSPYTPLKEKN